MIVNLALKNFRCFKDFTLDGIRPVTLIAGRNNVGKSTLLESLFLFMDRNASDVFWKLNYFRGLAQINLSPKMLWEPLFTDMNANNAIEISIKNNNEETQTVIISKDGSFSLSSCSTMSYGDDPNKSEPSNNSRCRGRGGTYPSSSRPLSTS